MDEKNSYSAVDLAAMLGRGERLMVDFPGCGEKVLRRVSFDLGKAALTHGVSNHKCIHVVELSGPFSTVEFVDG